MITTINPATETPLATYEHDAPEQVSAALDAAVDAQREWRHRSVEDRCTIVRAIARELRNDLESGARLITAEMGKPLAQSRAEIEKSAVTLDYYADNAAQMLQFQEIASNATRSGVRFDPLGVVLAIMPWNYPYWQFFRFLAPALSVGNGAVLKHAANVPGCAQRMMQVLDRAGVPQGLVANLVIDSHDVAGIIVDDRIAAVTLTGSTQVGAIVASQAGAVLKKQVLELGGSDPFIVLADADVELAARIAVNARFTASGQSCVNAKRFLVAKEVADEFVERFVAGAKALTVGDPTDEHSDLGPMARANLRDELHAQVIASVDAGAQLLLGGQLPEGPGYYYPPTVLDRVPLDSPAASEETFGPVAAIIRTNSEQDALRIANSTEYGLGAAIFSRDTSHAEELAAQIDAGAVFINGQVASDARLPFGGIKKSGYGRELSSFGLLEFVNIKTIWIGPAQ